MSVLGLLMLVTLPSIPFVKRFIGSRIIEEADAADVGEADEDLTRFRPDHIALGIAISFAICAGVGFHRRAHRAK